MINPKNIEEKFASACISKTAPKFWLLLTNFIIYFIKVNLINSTKLALHCGRHTVYLKDMEFVNDLIKTKNMEINFPMSGGVRSSSVKSMDLRKKSIPKDMVKRDTGKISKKEFLETCHELLKLEFGTKVKNINLDNKFINILQKNSEKLAQIIVQGANKNCEKVMDEETFYKVIHLS